MSLWSEIVEQADLLIFPFALSLSKPVLRYRRG
jgi:hypothetical protein